jgi:hypothetical protein
MARHNNVSILLVSTFVISIPLELFGYIITPICWCDYRLGVNVMHVDLDTEWFTRNAGEDGELDDNKIGPQDPCLAFYNYCLETGEYTEETDVENQNPPADDPDKTNGSEEGKQQDEADPTESVAASDAA